MKTSSFINIALILALFCGNLYAQTDDYVEIPFQLSNGQIIIDGELKRNKVKFTLSTTSPSSIEFSKFREELSGFEQKRFKNNLFNSYTPITVVSGLKFGNLKVNGLDMYWDGTFVLWKRPMQDVDGVLGYNFFKNNIVQINYKDKILRFYKKNPYKELIKSKTIDNDLISIVKLKVSTGLPPKEKSFTTTKDIKIKAKNLKILIDINETSKFLLSPKYNTLLNSSNNLDTLQLGNFTLENIKAELLNESDNSKKYDAVLGSDFFQDYILTLDYKKKIMILEKSK